MSQIQTNQCLHCNQNKEGLTFQVPIMDSNPPQFTTKHYCWTDLEDLLKETLDKCEDWERNKKKLFKEWLSECQQHQTFDWPWKEKSLIDYGPGPWQRQDTICVQCNVNLYWDVTPYEDSEKHLCSYCSNCNKRIEGADQSKHFEWNEEVLPVYKCEKKDLVKPSKYWKQANCLNCDTSILQENGKLLRWVSDCGSIYSHSNPRPNSKAHCSISTKRHINDLREINQQEWDDILTVLKDTTKKVNKIYHPIGYLFSVPVGRIAGQTITHFYARVVPKYYEGKGSAGIARDYVGSTPEQIEATKQAFNPNSENVIAEKSKVVARLHNETAFGYTVISTKQHLSIDKIENIDAETWSQIGELTLELMNKFESKLDCHDFLVSFRSGTRAQELLRKEKEEDIGRKTNRSQFEKYYTKEEIKFIIFPKFKAESKWGGRDRRPMRKDGKGGVGTMEEERIAEKLRDPEGYAKRLGAKDYSSLRGHKQERELKTLNMGRSSLYWSIHSRNSCCFNLI